MKISKQIFIGLFIVLLLLVFPLSFSHADTQQLTNYTHNDSDDGSPQIDNGYAVWSAYDAAGSQVYLYNITSGITTSLTNGGYNFAPFISDGKVVYEGDIDDTGELFIYDIASGTTTQITDGNFDNNFQPYISDGKVVWGTLDNELDLYDIASGSTNQITNSDGSVNGFFMNSGKVVWIQSVENNQQIFLYDIASGITTQITNSMYDNFTPNTDGQYVVWSGDDSKIFLYDIATGETTQITAGGDSGNYGLPEVNNGKVIFNDITTSAGGLFIYDIATGTTTHLWDVESNQNNEGIFEHQIKDGKVVWSGYDTTGTKIDIYEYDIASGTITQITNDTNQDQLPQISNDDIVWAKLIGRNWQIFLSNGVTPTPTPTFTPTPTPSPTPTPTPMPTTLNPTADTYLNLYGSNNNEGSSPILRVEQSSHFRTLVKFDESAIQTAVGSDPNYTAVLQFTIVDNGNNWGSSGRNIEVDRLTKDWVEGNGYINGNPNPDRGTGSGATWNCAVDPNISDNTKNSCSGDGTWDMDNAANWPFVSPTATSLITNHESGTVSFDVTSDVQNFLNGTNPNYGWLIKKSDETVTGKIDFGSRETSTPPVLIITPQ